MSAATSPNERLPLMYACSGCSSSAQMTNYLALRIDRLGLAEMSCIAGVGGGVAPLIKLARSGRPILAIDGCQLGCVRACLEGQGITPDIHIVLTEHGVHKRRHTDFNFEQAEEMANTVITAASSLGRATA